MSSTKATYNLLYEPWIDCRTDDEKICNFGLIDFNRNINQIKEIIVPKVCGKYFAFYELALHRFLNILYSVAIRISPWEDRDATKGLSNEEIELVEAYLKRFERKFDLMDDDFPFMQSTMEDFAQMQVTYAPTQKNFVTSFVHLPSENAINTNSLIGYNLVLENLNKESSTKDIINVIATKNKITPKEAVYHLLYLNAFAKCAGVAGCSSSSSTPELYVLFCGKTVGETIKTNLIPHEDNWTKPIWERDGIYSYYSEPEKIDLIGYSFYPNRLCRFEWNDNTTMSMMYAPHNKKIWNDTSKNMCRIVCEQFYQGVDKDALIRAKDDGVVTIKYSRTENWLHMLMSAIITNNEIPENSQSAKNIFSGAVVLPKTITIVLYGRSADGKSGVYQYSERIEQSVDSKILCHQKSVDYLDKYIRLVRSQFAITQKVIDKYYKILNKVNPHAENKVPFINQKISLYAHQKLNIVLDILVSENDIETEMNKVFNSIKMYTKSAIFEMLNENVLAAAQAYKSIVFGGKK